MPERPRNLYLVWREYQRRADVLAPLLDADVVFLGRRWRSRWLRPVDYLLDLVASLRMVRQRRPAYLILQTPPPYAALAGILGGTPYILDVHNASIQGRWARVPLARWLAKRARFLLAHNDEAKELARRAYPGCHILTLRDPVVSIGGREQGTTRNAERVLFVCSFGHDEPIALIHALIERRPDLQFVITAPIHRLPPAWGERFRRLPNLELTGYLPTEEYQRLLSTSGVAVVLTTREATQPSGACEALAADTPLVVSRTSLTTTLFGTWAHVVEHDVDVVSRAIDEARSGSRSLAPERTRWTHDFTTELEAVQSAMLLGGTGGAERV